MAQPSDISVLLSESVDNLLKVRELPIQDLSSDNIVTIENQQAVVNAILKSLSRESLPNDEVIQMFERILCIHAVVEEIPDQFYLILSKKEILGNVVRFCAKEYVAECRIQQLCYCVLTKILQSCHKQNLSVKLLRLLLKDYDIISKISFSLTVYIDQYNEYSDRDCQPTFELQQYCSSIAILLKFMWEMYDVVQVLSLKRQICDGLFNLTYSCINDCASEEDVCEYGLNLLTKFLHENPTKCFVFVKDGNYRLLFQIVSKNPFEERVLEAATSLLMVLFEQCVMSSYLTDVQLNECTENEKVYMKASISYFMSETINYIFEKLNFYDDQPVFASKFLRIIETISNDPTVAENLIDHDTVRILINQMKRHMKDSQVQLTTINAVDNLLRQPSEDNVDSTWLAEILAAMINHQDNARVQEAACRALTNRILNNPSLANLIGENDEHVLPLHSTVLAALNIHADDVYVFQAACIAIHAMTINSQELQRLFYVKGASSFILKEMKENVDEVDIQGWGCYALRALALNHPYQEELMFIEGILALVSENLLRFKEKRVLTESIGLLVCLANDMPIVERQCVTLNLPELIMNIAMENASCSDELIETVLEAIALFVLTEEKQLLNIKYVRNVRHLLSCNEANEIIQAKGCIIVQLFIDDFEFTSNHSVTKEILSIIKEVVKRFENSVMVINEACVALFLLFLHNERGSVDMKKVAVECGVHEILFDIIADSNEDDDCAHFACQCLIKLAADQSLKDLLLQKACLGNFTKCAQLMMECGASLESRSNHPLCIAVNNGNLTLVELLLTYDRTDADKALTICLQIGRHDIAGVLLHHIGFELDSITWGALNLEELMPELFYHTLTYRIAGKSITPCLPVCNQAKRKNAVSRQRSVTQYGAATNSTRVTSNRTSNHRMTRQRSSSDSEIEEHNNSAGRQISTVSGPHMPYNRLDPRLERLVHKDSPTRKEFIDVHYFGQPLSTGKLLQPSVRSLTPIPRTRSMLRNSFISVDSGNCTESRPRGISENLSPLPKVSKPNSPRSRVISCRSPTPDVLDDCINNIRLIDISHNKLSSLDAFLTCPSTLIISLLSNLEILLLNDNQIVDFSGAHCNALPHLLYLNLSNNQLQRFPNEIFLHGKLQNLDLSNNCIAHADEKVRNSLSLLKLDLSGNKFREFPVWIGDSFPRLQKLYLNRNHIRQIPNQINGFRSLKEINLRNNHITRVSGSFFHNCVSLEKINLSFNKLELLPEYTPNTLSRLSEIKLSHNHLKGPKPSYVPQLILSIPSLVLIDLSHNKITHLPNPQLWTSRIIRDLDLSNNRIGSIELTGSIKQCWPCIQRLNFSNNKIHEIPKDIGLLETLNSLDFSFNNICKLPDEIGLLHGLSEFPLGGLNLQHDPAVLKGGIKDIVSYFRCKLKKSVPYHRIKLMLVGLAARGKTSLMCRLSSRSKPRNVATNGITINDWELRPPKSKKKEENNLQRKLHTFIMNTWDFAGQEEFYSTHQYFLTSRALYVAVFNASKGKEELESLTTWLLNIQAAAPGAMVILAGTHADQIPKETREQHQRDLEKDLIEFKKKPGFPKIQATAIVNCLKETEAMEKLREQIYEVILNFTYEGQSIMDKYVPQSYVVLEDLIRKESIKMKMERKLPIKQWEEIVMLSLENGIALNEEELLRALKFLKETGSIMHFTDPAGNFNELFFIDPQWLCEMMARVVTVREINPFIDVHGVLTKTNAFRLFPKDVYTLEFVDRYFRLLRKFEIMFPLSEEEYLITARLPERVPSMITTLQHEFHHSNIIIRRYIFPYTPSGFWSRLITRILLFVKEDPLRMAVAECEYWQSGIYIKWSCTRYFLIAPVQQAENTFDIYVPTNSIGFKLLGRVVDLVDNLLEEWYPGLSDVEFSINNTKLERLSPCDSCRDTENPFFFTLEDCTIASNQTDMMIECENCGLRGLRMIAPDVIFADIDPEFVYDKVAIQFNSQHQRLGVGAFADVYKASVNGTHLAVKVFRDSHGFNPSRLLRQEVDILTRLHHPCLISLVGVSLKPRMLLLEHAPLGNLAETLLSGRGLSRGMEHRIALQITEGLVYLHDQNIVYRDLKPGNVLIFSLSMGIFINVKLSDYGISQCSSSMMGLTARKGTVGYQAPEVIQRGVEYNWEVDMFSFGVTLYEIITGGAHPYGDVSFTSQINEAVLSKRPMDSISKHKAAPWPDIENLIQQCLHANPERRPSARTVREALLNVEVVCMKREIAITKDQSVECTAVRRFTEGSRDTLEVWVGSGDSGLQSQISWFTIDGERKRHVQGMIVKEGRILCMVCHQKYVIVGTKQCALVVFDADMKEKRYTIKLDDSVLCMKVLPSNQLVVGLANGKMLIFLVNKLVSGDFEYLSPNFNMDISPAAIACLAVTGNRILCGYGSHVLEVRLETFVRTRMWKVGVKTNNTVTEILLSQNHIFVACKDSHVISAYENDKVYQRPSMIDCHLLLGNNNNEDIPQRECRVVSMAIVDRNTLWVGCGNGHILLLDAINLNASPLAVIARHKSSVRSINVMPRMCGRTAYVVTAGKGFNHWNRTGEVFNDEDMSSDGGYVLVWDADLPRQKKTMCIEHQKRNDLAVKMASGEQ